MIFSLLFYFFAAILVFSAIRVISSKNPVQAALFLILSFFSCSALWLLLEAEFLAIMLILVYVGAVMVLFLFVIMMLDINIEEFRAGFVKYLPVGIVVGVLLIAEIVVVILNSSLKDGTDELSKYGVDYSNTKAVGELMYSKYLFAFEIAALVLLVALVAAVALSLRNNFNIRSSVKRQKINKQIKARARDRVRLVDLPKEDQND